jgi:hypothetical protein
MTDDAVAAVFAGVCPWLVLVRGIQSLAGRHRSTLRGWRLLLMAGAVALAVLLVPFAGLPVARWIAGLSANFSIPLTGVLAAAVWERAFGTQILSPRDWRTAWLFGALGGLTLYPFALGLSSFDPYEWGWRFSPLFVAVGALTTWLLWKQNRFGLLLLLAAVGFHLRLLESPNYWDYLLDPVFWLVSLIVIGRRSMAHLRAGVQPRSRASQPS